jgi:hypothetical protein
MWAAVTRTSQASPASRQNDKQKASALRVVSIQYTTGAGLCGCYCGGELHVNPGQATLFIRPALECQRRNPKKYREFKVDADFSSKHWRELEQLIDHDALFALPDKIGCPGCTDGLTEFLEVKFSDHTKKSVFYDGAPKDILALSQKLSALEAKLEQELPANRPND